MSTRAKLGLLGSLYFSMGLPFGFFLQATPALLPHDDFPLRDLSLLLFQLGIFSRFAAAWAWRFLWAPVVDRYAIPGMGRRASWIIPLQLASVAILLGLAVSGGTSLGVLVVAALLFHGIAATQHMATDGLAVDLFAPKERGYASALQVAGYALGIMVAGESLPDLGSVGTWLAMAGLTALFTLPILWAREPRQVAADAAQTGPPPHFLRRPGTLQLIFLIAAYKAGDLLAKEMLYPFVSETPLGGADIRWLIGDIGFVAGLAGALCSGVLINRLGRKRSLMAFGLFQAASIAGYAGLALGEPPWIATCLVFVAADFASGMATAALVACMMDWCSRTKSATDYAVQACMLLFVTSSASELVRLSPYALGSFGGFCLAAGLALGGLVVVARCFPSADAARVLRGEPHGVASAPSPLGGS
jgi:predicted MFS family arabinose efflux permease